MPLKAAACVCKSKLLTISRQKLWTGQIGEQTVAGEVRSESSSRLSPFVTKISLQCRKAAEMCIYKQDEVKFT